VTARFHTLYQAERDAHRAVRRWRALYSRKRPLMAALPKEAGERLHWRLKDEGFAAEDRHRETETALDAHWDAVSRSIQPLGQIDSARASDIDAGRAGARGLIGGYCRLKLERQFGLYITDAEVDELIEATVRGQIDSVDDAAMILADMRGRQ
jgi:hypothetical protein